MSDTGKIAVGRVIPMLRIFDEARAREFYVDFLGFAVDWEHRFDEGMPLYLQVSRDGCVLHLTEHHGDACPGAALYVEVRGIDGLHAELTARDYPFYKPQVEETEFGTRNLAVLDPFGNRVVFTQRS